MFGFKKKTKPAVKAVKDAFVNYVSGAGSDADKSQQGAFQYSRITEDFISLERTYVESWACAKIIDIPVDDMMIYPRCITNLDDSDNLKLENFERDIGLTEKVNHALKAARLYGTAFLVMVTDDNLLNLPMNPNSKIINLKNLIVIDRFHAAVLEWDRDITTPNFNEPLLYQFTIRNVEPFIVHHSRVIRINGVKPLTANHWESGYNWYWGVSEIVKILNIVTQEEGMASIVSYLMNEASVPILKIPELQDALAGAPDALGGLPNDTQSPIDKMVTNLSNLKSIYRTTYLDAEMDINRLEPNFSNFAELFDRLHTRMAAAADIPQTRLFGKSPAGMNATGDADAENYAIMIASRQEKQLRPIYNKLDPIIQKTLGIANDIEYKFKPLLDISENDKSKNSLANAQRDQIYLMNGVITEDEIRKTLYDNEVYDIDPDLPAVGSNLDYPSDNIPNSTQETATMPKERTQEKIKAETIGASTNAKGKTN